MSFFNPEVQVTLGKIPRLSDDVLSYIVYEAEEGEFPEEVIEAAEGELDLREHEREQFPHDDTPSLQDRGLYPGSYES